MEADDNEFFETTINLNKSEELDSAKIDKSFVLSCFIKDDMFQIQAQDDFDIFLIQFRIQDWIRRREREFTKRINNFKLLAKTIREAYEKKRLVLNKIDEFSLMMTIYYTVIFKEEKISFELYKKSEDEEEQKRLIGQFYSESEPVKGENDLRFRVELLGYSKKFEDYGETSFIKIRVKNTGTCTWDRKITSFKCVPEFSTLLCNDYILKEDVYPDNEYNDIELEFMKKNPDNIDTKQFTSIQLNVYDIAFEPMIFLDFENAFKDEVNKTNLKKPIKPEKNIINQNKNKEKENKINDFNIKDSEDTNENKINIINEDKNEENENKIIIHNKEQRTKEDELNYNLINDKENDEIKINLDEDNKSKIIFSNVKVNISFNVVNMNKIICVDVNEKKVEFNVDKNKVRFIDSKGNKIYVEEKKPAKDVKKLKGKEENNQINIINPGNNQNQRKSVFDRAKFFEK